MTRTVPLALVVWVHLAASAAAQSADKIVARHINAIGGTHALEQIVSSTVTGTVTLPDGRSETFIQETKRPNLLHISMAWSGGRWSTGFNGRSVWQDDPRDGLRTLMGRAAANTRSEAAYANRDVFGDGGQRQFTLMGKDQVGGRPVFVVDAMTHDVITRTLFVDADTYLLLKEQHETEAGSESRIYGDYRRVGQVMEPHRIEWHRGHDRLVITVATVAHNTALDERVFDFPRTAAAPPLDVAEFLSSVTRNQQDIEALIASYAYTAATTSRELDQTGRITKETEDVSEIFVVGGRTVQKQVKRNGRELSEAEKRREQRRVDEIVREYQKQSTRSVATGGLASPIPPISSFLRMYEFTNPRREQMRGTTALVFDIQPKRDVQARNDLERRLSSWKMAGTYWIDERARQVIRTDTYLTERSTSLFLEGMWIASEQALVNNEVWLPSFTESQRTAAFGLTFVDKRWYHRTTTQYSDYRKFNVASDYQITLPEVK
ncbi:MAG TPA: hypothetical protein VH436_30000 [Vicinamibacterales bacterium]